jgi:hypothetical protein
MKLPEGGQGHLSTIALSISWRHLPAPWYGRTKQRDRLIELAEKRIRPQALGAATKSCQVMVSDVQGLPVYGLPQKQRQRENCKNRRGIPYFQPGDSLLLRDWQVRHRTALWPAYALPQVACARCRPRWPVPPVVQQPLCLGLADCGADSQVRRPSGRRMIAVAAALAMAMAASRRDWFVS